MGDIFNLYSVNCPCCPCCPGWELVGGVEELEPELLMLVQGAGLDRKGKDHHRKAKSNSVEKDIF